MDIMLEDENIVLSDAKLNRIKKIALERNFLG